MDVALIQWPSDEALRQQMAATRRPRLLLVDSDADPPDCVDVLEDWVRLPVSRVDRKARIRSLESRVEAGTPPPPVLHGGTTLEYRGARTHLSALQTDLVGLMLERFGVVVSRQELAEAAWPDHGPNDNNLDVAMGRLRKQLVAVGLGVRTVRSRGYLLTDETTP